MNLCICGLGYVGTVTAACLAKGGHRVIGVDVNADKVAAIRDGEAPIIEKGLAPLIQEGVRARRLTAMTDLECALAQADATMVAVGTPSRANGSLDTTALERVCRDIGGVLRAARRPHTVIIRSTVLPGTCRDLLIPLLEDAAGRRLDDALGVCYNPEFLREGTAVADFATPPFTVIGGENARAMDAAASLYEGIDGPLERTGIEPAEMLKYACNAFHALKIAFANEIGSFAAQHGMDGREVMRLVCRDRKLNISPSYLRPGFAFGGSCLPKDLRALAYRAHQSDMDLPLLNAILPSNRRQLERGLRMIFESGKSRVGLLGLTFKSGTDDLRESPYVELAETLIGKGYRVLVHDGNLSVERLVGANRAYMERHLPHIAQLLTTLERTVAESEVIVVCNGDPQHAQAMQGLRPEQQVIDLVGLPKGEMAGGLQTRGIAW